MIEHTHDGDRLTFACPACIEKVNNDQHLAAVAEQPDRPLTVAWSTSQHGTVTIDAQYLDTEQPADVAERNYSKIIDAVGNDGNFDGVEIQESSFGKRLPSGRRSKR